MMKVMMKVAHEGAEALCHAYLSTSWGDLRFLSVGGPAEAVKAVLAALGRRQSLSLHRHTGPGWTSAGWLFANGKHRILTRKLPCGQVHGVFYAETALPGSRSQGFTLLLPEALKAEAVVRFYRHLDLRTPLPLHPSWAPWLWETFQVRGWLRPLEGEGPWLGWEVSWEEELLQKLAAEAVRVGVLQVS